MLTSHLQDIRVCVRADRPAGPLSGRPSVYFIAMRGVAPVGQAGDRRQACGLSFPGRTGPARRRQEISPFRPCEPRGQQTAAGVRQSRPPAPVPRAAGPWVASPWRSGDQTAPTTTVQARTPCPPRSRRA